MVSLEKLHVAAIGEKKGEGGGEAKISGRINQTILYTYHSSKLGVLWMMLK